MTSAPLILEDDPVIPGWEKISKLPTFEAWVTALRAAAADPAIKAAIKPSRFTTIPGVSLNFEANPYLKWGLQYQIRPTGIQLTPYGESGYTTLAFKYAAERQADARSVARTAAELILLGMRHAHQPRYVVAKAPDVLRSRLVGEARIPYQLRLSPRPSNSMQNQVIRAAFGVDASGNLLY